MNNNTLRILLVSIRASGMFTMWNGNTRRYSFEYHNQSFKPQCIHRILRSDQSTVHRTMTVLHIHKFKIQISVLIIK